MLVITRPGINSTILSPWGSPTFRILVSRRIIGWLNIGQYGNIVCHRIGWWENLQEPPVFDGKYDMTSSKFDMVLHRIYRNLYLMVKTMVSGFDFLLNQSIEYGNILWLMAYGNISVIGFSIIFAILYVCQSIFHSFSIQILHTYVKMFHPFSHEIYGCVIFKQVIMGKWMEQWENI